MFTKESLYINAIKYDTQLKLEYKKLNNDEIIEVNNSVFLVDDEILARDIALKLNASQQEIDKTYISTLLISDTTQLVPKNKSSKLKDCAISELNSDYDIAVLKTTLFETKNYFEKTGIDYIYSAFHILNLHLEQNICKNQLLVFLFNNKVFILILGDDSSIVFNKTVDLPTFESIKKTHFYEDDIFGQKLFDEIYYLELNSIVHDTLNTFYESKAKVFVDKITILYTLKQLSVEQIKQFSDELLIEVDYHPINIDEEIFELTKDKHLKKSFIKPRKKRSKTNFNNLFIALFFLLAFAGIYKLFVNMNTQKQETSIINKQDIKLPDHVKLNDIVTARVKSILEQTPYDVVLNELKLEEENLNLKIKLLKKDTFIKSYEPMLKKVYKDVNIKILEEKSTSLMAKVSADKPLELKDISYKTYKEKYIVDEFLPISRVSEQLKILFPKDTIVKFLSSQNNKVTKFNYLINMLVSSPNEFYEMVEMLNKEFYSINVSYPLSIVNTDHGLEIEFRLVFNQPK